VDEGIRILIAAGAGFIAGLLGETFKFPLVRYLKRHQVRRALYKDLALIRISLKVSEKYYQHDHRLEKTRLDAFDYFYNTERAAFYEIVESHVLSHLYDLIRRYANEEDPEEAQNLLGTIMMSFHTYTAAGTLDEKLLNRFERNFVRYTVIDSERYHGTKFPALRGFLGRMRVRRRVPDDAPKLWLAL
jgi:hypothetical protein